MSQNQRMSLEELEQTPEYQVLTPKQRLFVATYIQGGADGGQYDPVHAVTVAYNCKDRNSARVLSYEMFRSIRVVAALNRHFNREPLEAFLMVLDRAIQNKHLKESQLHALRLKADLLGLPSRMPPDGRTIKDVLDEVRKDGRKIQRTGRKPRKTPEPTTPAKPTEEDTFSKRLLKTI
jgi:hypothetical protein